MNRAEVMTGASVSGAVFHDAGTQAVIFGDGGKIVLDDPWIPQGNRQCLSTGFRIFCDGQEPEEVVVETDKPTYAIETEYVADRLPALEAAWPAMSWAD